MWHTNLGVAEEDGTGHRVYPTRALFDGVGILADLADFTTAQHLQMAAAHELGHFLINWKTGAYMRLISVQESPGNVIPAGVVSLDHPDGETSHAVLVGGAAGERAADRWLREEGLWTPARAVYGELQGETDRTDAQRIDPSITFDGGPNDYRLLQDEADKILEDVWPVLMRGLKHFSTYAKYTGDAMCCLLGIANNPAV